MNLIATFFLIMFASLKTPSFSILRHNFIKTNATKKNVFDSERKV